MSDKPEALKPCPVGPNGKHQLDTTMESGPNNCFFCETSLKGKQYDGFQEPRASDSALADELEALLAKASAAPWAYRPCEFDDWGVIRGPEQAVDWAEYPVRPHIAQTRNSDIQDDDYLAECRAQKKDPWGADAKLIVALRNHAVTILTALRSNAGKASHE